MEIEKIATAIWRIAGSILLAYSVATLLIQILAVISTFGQLANGTPFSGTMIIVSILMWPVFLGLTGTLMIFFSQKLARLVTRDLS